MNVVMIMSGGVGRRFGADLPKQYLKINDKPIIDYVIEKVKLAKSVDKIVIVMDEKYKDISSYINKKSFIIAPNGEDRYGSISNGLDAIKKIGGCDKLLITDAVAPMIYPELIDYYFDMLDSYDIVITAQKITGALGNYSYDSLDREDYYMTQSPEAFHYKELIKYFNPKAKSQELAWQLPKSTTKFLNFNFKNNLKLTYNFELDYLKNMIDNEAKSSEYKFDNVINRDFFKTKGLKDFLLRINKDETEDFLNDAFFYYQELCRSHGPFNNVSINQSSRYGIILSLTYNKEEEMVVKIIPRFLNRYETEKEAYKKLSSKIMCELVDTDDVNRALFLKKLDGNSSYFEDNIAMTDFFNRVFKHQVKYDDSIKSFHDFYKELKEKEAYNKKLAYCDEDIKKMLSKSVNLYNKYFKNTVPMFIHGDLRCNNILKNEETYYAIDPIGYKAPGVFEACRFIIDDININKSFDMQSRLNILISYFSKWCDVKELLISTYIFLSFIAYNSTFENTDDLQTKEYVELGKILIKEIGKKTK